MTVKMIQHHENKMEAHIEKQMTMKTQWPQTGYATAGLRHMYPNVH